MAWESKRLDEIATIQTGPFGSQLHKKDYVDVGTPIITVEHLGQYRIRRQNIPMVTSEDANRLQKYSLLPGDIVFSRVGSVDQSSYVGEAESGWLFSGRCLRVRPNVKKADPLFTYYALNTAGLKNYIRAIAVGATMPSINTAILSEIPISLPALNEQQQIATVLGSLDDKIAANQHVIHTSIALAESIVSRNLTAGHTRLSDVAQVTMGTSPKGEYLSEESTGLPFYQGVRDFGEITPHQRIYTDSPVRQAEAGDILFAVRAPVGEVNIASEHTAIGRGLAAIRGLKNHNALFYLLRSRPEIWSMHQDSGTVFASINKTDLANASIPEIEMDSTDSELVDELHREALTLTNQNITLVKTRDELLPLLMSGKITVREAGQEAAAAGAQIQSEENEV